MAVSLGRGPPNRGVSALLHCLCPPVFLSWVEIEPAGCDDVLWQL